mgnify:FL=1|tara:strand:+ start:665 stop:1375 length:711 start_codon:yes stop_codon:yes gene_type:complete
MLGFYELDIDIDLDRLISEHEIIKEKYDYHNYYTNFDLYDHVYKKSLSQESTQKHIERYKAVQENVEKGWSGISLISTDGSLYNDMTEGDMLADHKTELEKHLPYMFELVEKLEGLNSKVRILRIAPKGSIAWHSHVHDQGFLNTHCAVQIPIEVPEKCYWATIEPKNWTDESKRLSWPEEFDQSKINLLRFEPGKAYTFNCEHYHNVFNYGDEFRITIMFYAEINKIKHLMKEVQ